jgi:predicted RNase H-like HicB family nuclease
MTALFVPSTDEDRKRLEAAGIVPCPSCGNPTHRSDLIHIQGTEKDSCLTEYFESAKKCIHSIRHEDGSWSEMIVGISGMTSEGKTKDECRKKLMKDLMNWIRDKQLNGSAIPAIPQPQFCLLSDRARLPL